MSLSSRFCFAVTFLLSVRELHALEVYTYSGNADVVKTWQDADIREKSTNGAYTFMNSNCHLFAVPDHPWNLNSLGVDLTQPATKNLVRVMMTPGETERIKAVELYPRFESVIREVVLQEETKHNENSMEDVPEKVILQVETVEHHDCANVPRVIVMWDRKYIGETQYADIPVNDRIEYGAVRVIKRDPVEEEKNTDETEIDSPKEWSLWKMAKRPPTVLQARRIEGKVEDLLSKTWLDMIANLQALAQPPAVVEAGEGGGAGGGEQIVVEEQGNDEGQGEEEEDEEGDMLDYDAEEGNDMSSASSYNPLQNQGHPNSEIDEEGNDDQI